MKAEKIRILIADDHPLIRNGLRQVLANESDLELVGEAANADELFNSLNAGNVDVLVLDLMLSAGGVDVLDEVRRKYPGIRILILTVHSEDKFAVTAMKRGANGYLTKDNACPEILRAIRQVASGKKYVSAATAESLANTLDTDSTSPPHLFLSAREFHVLCKIADGKTVSEIAAEMSLSVKTVSTYRARLLEKMKMHNNSELVRYVIQNGLA